MHGPTVRRLIILKTSLIMAPPGGGVDGVLDTLLRPGGLAEATRKATRKATEWVQAAIAAVRAAPDNTFADDEAIAAEILRRVALQNPTVCEKCGGSKYHSRLNGYRCRKCG